MLGELELVDVVVHAYARAALRVPVRVQSAARRSTINATILVNTRTARRRRRCTHVAPGRLILLLLGVEHQLAAQVLELHVPVHQRHDRVRDRAVERYDRQVVVQLTHALETIVI